MIQNKSIDKFINLELLAKQVVEGFITGLHKSPFHGFSVEFAEHRLYNKGESIRHIDWKLYGRTEKFFVKRFEEETNLRCRIIIDQSSSMYFPNMYSPSLHRPNKLFFSVLCAASLMNLFKRQRDAVGLSLFSNKVNLHTSEKTSIKHHKFLLHELHNILNQEPLMKTSGLIEALHQIAENIHKRSLVILFSDMFDNSYDNEKLFSALHHLKFNKHEVILFHVIDNTKEIEFKYENRPYKFIDMETGDELKLSPNEVRKEYQEQTQEFLKKLKNRCLKYNIDFVESDINNGYEPILESYLVKRSKLN